jgi:AraC-like DNA-binding protein
MGMRFFHAHLHPLPEFPALTHVHEVHTDARHLIPQHIHETFEISYIASGRGLWNVEGETHEVRAHDVFITRPGEIHGGRPDPRHPYRVFVVGIDLSALPLPLALSGEAFPGGTVRFAAPPDESTLRLIESRRSQGVIVYDAPLRASSCDSTKAGHSEPRASANGAPVLNERIVHGARGAEHIFWRLLSELDADGEFGHSPAARALQVMMAQTLLVELLILMARCQLSQPSTAQAGAGWPKRELSPLQHPPRRHEFAQLVEWLRTRLADPPTLPQMARYVRLSPAHFAVVFKQEVGTTPGECMTLLRIQEAAARLASPKTLSVTGGARQLGFSSPQYFSSVFKKHMGCTPSAWQRRPREMPICKGTPPPHDLSIM